MSATKSVSLVLAPFCLIFAALGSALGPAIWWGPMVIFGGLYSITVVACAIAEYEGAVAPAEIDTHG